MRLRDDEHVRNALASTFLAKGHLHDGVIDGFARNLTTKLVELAVRNFEVGG